MKTEKDIFIKARHFLFEVVLLLLIPLFLAVICNMVSPSGLRILPKSAVEKGTPTE